MHTRIASDIRRVGLRIPVTILIASLSMGCAGSNEGEGGEGLVADEPLLNDAADSGDWPRVAALYRSLLVPEVGDYFPGQGGTIRRGSWLTERPAAKLTGVERVAVEVARHWRRREAAARGDKTAGVSLLAPALIDLPANAETRRPATLKKIPALLALHRATILNQATPDTVVIQFERYSREWDAELTRLRTSEDGTALTAAINAIYAALIQVGVDAYWWLPPPVAEPHRRLRSAVEDLARQVGESAILPALQAAWAEYDRAWATSIVAPTAPEHLLNAIPAALTP